MKPLPRLVGSPEGTYQSCDSNPSRCKECDLYKVRCVGCISSDKRVPGAIDNCAQSECATECNSCGGAKGVDIPTICCKSPLLPVAFPDLPKWGVPGELNDLSEFHEVSPLPISQLGINANQGNPSSLREDPYPEETQVVAVALRHLWSPRNGWRSHDLKDYLKLDSHMKLMVHTFTKDDELEDFWNHDMHGGPSYREVGVDYSMPIMFSNYYQSGNLKNFFDFIRSMRSLKLGRSDFIPMSASFGLRVDDIILEAAKSVKNAVFNAQFLYNDSLLKRKIRDLVYWHKVLPLDVSFFVGGVFAADKVLNIKKFLGERKVHFFSLSPFLAAQHGKRYTTEGLEVSGKNFSREDLLHMNQRTYMRICSLDLKDLSLTKKEKLFVENISKVVEVNRRYYEGHNES